MNTVMRTLPIDRRRSSGHTAEVVVSSSAVDREGDIIEQAGGDWSGWMKTGGPILWADDHRRLPVAKDERIWTTASGKTHAVIRWVENDSFATRVRNVFTQGLSAMSIGFKPTKSTPLPGGRGIHFQRWIGLEASFVPVPANSDAIVVSRSLGLPVPADDALFLEVDGVDDEVVCRGSAAALRQTVIAVVAPLDRREIQARVNAGVRE